MASKNQHVNQIKWGLEKSIFQKMLYYLKVTTYNTSYKEEFLEKMPFLEPHLQFMLVKRLCVDRQ